MVSFLTQDPQPLNRETEQVSVKKATRALEFPFLVTHLFPIKQNWVFRQLSQRDVGNSQQNGLIARTSLPNFGCSCVGPQRSAQLGMPGTMAHPRKK